MTTHIVKQGECLISIAHQYGLDKMVLPKGKTYQASIHAGWARIYNAPENKQLKNKRSDPKCLFPGDKVFIPDKSNNDIEKEYPVAVNLTNYFVLHKDKALFRVTMQKKNGQLLSNASYELRVEKKKYTGESDSEGVIEHPIEPTDATGRLKIFTGEGEYDYLEWALYLGNLDPIEKTAGVQGRLQNRLHDSGEIDNDAGNVTKAALQRFQANQKLSITGKAEQQTQNKLSNL